MELNYSTARQLKGRIVQFMDEKGRLVTGRIAKVDQDGIYMEEHEVEKDYEGFGYGFFGPRRGFYRRGPYFRGGAYGFRRYPYAGVFGITLLPFLLW